MVKNSLTLTYIIPSLRTGVQHSPHIAIGSKTLDLGPYLSR